MVCCDKWDARYGCVHEICPACYCHKEHDQLVCTACHEFNADHEPYLSKYGAENVRST